MGKQPFFSGKGPETVENAPPLMLRIMDTVQYVSSPVWTAAALRWLLPQLARGPGHLAAADAKPTETGSIPGSILD